jgi:predicted metal-dependent hydrolase
LVFSFAPRIVKILGADFFVARACCDESTLNRAVRNKLCDIFLGAFGDAAKRDAIFRLALFFELCADDEPKVSLRDLEAAWEKACPELATRPWRSPALTDELERILEAGRDRGVCQSRVDSSDVRSSTTLWYEPHSSVLPYLRAVQARVRIYAQVVREATERVSALERLEPLHRAVAEAALCFNHGLFFEAHEHLEHHWAGLPRGSTKRFVQGVIQISVGFHHAMRGSYDGAINQLEKGLTKLAGSPQDTLGLDCDRLLRDVTAARQRIVATGSRAMRPALLEELPRIHLCR